MNAKRGKESAAWNKTPVHIVVHDHCCTKNKYMYETYIYIYLIRTFDKNDLISVIKHISKIYSKDTDVGSSSSSNSSSSSSGSGSDGCGSGSCGGGGSGSGGADDDCGVVVVVVVVVVVGAEVVVVV